MMFSFPAPVLGPLILSWWFGSFMFWSVMADANSLPVTQDCELARAKCAYRASCYKSLHSYMVDCADVLAGRTSKCPWACQRALISLTSTEFGLALSTCDCRDNDFCRRSKERVEVCRPEVSHATADDTVVSCSVAKWICAADTLCSTALDFYHRLCRPMFHGRKCTPRCNNSLAILDRQEKAAKLRDCYCDGKEDFPCYSIKQNTQKLCYGRDEWINNDHHLFPFTTPDPQSGSSVGVPCGLLCYLILSAAVLLTFRTKNDLSSIIDHSMFSDVAEDNMKRDHSIDSLSQKAPTHRQKPWPWWWTSEEMHKLRSFSM